jgi:hypothetical protein
MDSRGPVRSTFAALLGCTEQTGVRGPFVRGLLWDDGRFEELGVPAGR